MPSLSGRFLRDLRQWLELQCGVDHYIYVIDRAMKPKRSVAMARQRSTMKRLDKRAETNLLRGEVFGRCNGWCECGCGDVVHALGAYAGEMDHFWGRGQEPQSIANCWALTRRCHREKTDNRPSRIAWLDKFRAHCIRNGYMLDALQAGRELEKESAKAEQLAALRARR